MSMLGGEMLPDSMLPMFNIFMPAMVGIMPLTCDMSPDMLPGGDNASFALATVTASNNSLMMTSLLSTGCCTLQYLQKVTSSWCLRYGFPNTGRGSTSSAEERMGECLSTSSTKATTGKPYWVRAFCTTSCSNIWLLTMMKSKGYLGTSGGGNSLFSAASSCISLKTSSVSFKASCSLVCASNMLAQDTTSTPSLPSSEAK
mmetsp:Transcript_27793/g.38410  ORF Transcript_27793/g.38410 Transcript_27793/m.38410 type:complete len:201 (+) Transcript_27793:128-730(+)